MKVFWNAAIVTIAADIVTVWFTGCATQRGSPCRYLVNKHNNASGCLASKGKVPLSIH